MLVSILLLVAAALASQAPDHSAHASADVPHMCRFGPAVNVSALGPPRLMTGIGTSHLKISTTSAEAQQFFDQGLNLLHGFWDTEAYRAFREATRLDPAAAMAWWGVFTALGQNGQEMAAERRQALDKAVALASKATEHEQFYIRAASLLMDPQKGRAAYIAEMEALIDRFPDDVEAQLLLANSLSTSVASYAPDGRPREGKLYGQAILKNLLVTHPRHAAVHHYWIHAVENGPRPESAIASAQLLPELAPAIGHMLHMPGHIYYRIGEYGKAREAFQRSLAFDEAYLAREQMHPINHWNYVHNLDYFVASAAESGRRAEGLRHAQMLADLPADADRLRAQGIGYILYGARTAIARLHIRYNEWRDAVAALDAALANLPAAGTLAKGYYEGLKAYASGMVAVGAHRLDDARAASAALDTLWSSLSQEKIQAGGDWYFRHAIRVLDVQRAELKGVIQSAAGEHDAGIAALEDAALKERDLGYWEPPHYTRPVLESLANAYARAGRWPEAREAFERASKLRPGSGHPIRGLARAAAWLGRPDDAAAACARLQQAWKDADSDLRACPAK